MKTRRRFVIGRMVVIPLLFAPACSSSGANTNPSPIVEAPIPAVSSMQELYEAGDYAGVVAAFSADAMLALQDTALFHAAIASAMPGHVAHDPVRALRLLTRLRADHPASLYLTEARLLIHLLEAAAAMQNQNDRLKTELEQLKAIDLGQQP